MRITMPHSCAGIPFIWPVIAKQQNNESVCHRQQHTASVAQRMRKRGNLRYLDEMYYFQPTMLAEAEKGKNSPSSSFQFNYLQTETQWELCMQVYSVCRAAWRWLTFMKHKGVQEYYQLCWNVQECNSIVKRWQMFLNTSHFPSDRTTFYMLDCCILHIYCMRLDVGPSTVGICCFGWHGPFGGWVTHKIEINEMILLIIVTSETFNLHLGTSQFH